MALIVAARFQTFSEAENAARHLFAQGYAEDAVHLFYVNSAGGHARYPLGGDRRWDPDAKGAQRSAIIGGAMVGLVGAAVGGGLVFLFDVEKAPYAAVGAAAVGAYVGSLSGALWSTGRGRSSRGDVAAKPAASSHPPVRHAGVLVAVHVDVSSEAQACAVLRAAGGADIERARGQWRDGQWVDFDPVQPPQSAGFS
jgi:hypothetical protein